MRKVADGIRGDGMLVTPKGDMVVAEPGVHSDEPGKVWLIASDGKRAVLDSGLLGLSGIAYSPDRNLLFRLNGTPFE